MKIFFRTIWLPVILLFVVLLASQCSKDETGGGGNQFRVDNYYPNSGNVGTLVNILGVGFGADLSAYSVTFGGVTGQVLGITNEELVVQAPVSGLSGKIVLRYGGKDVEIGNYTYQNLSIREISSNRAQVGAHLRISGYGFSRIESVPRVTINDTEAAVLNVSDTLLVVEVPQNGSGSGPVVVRVGTEESVGPIFAFMGINSVKPLSGGSGTRVTIEGYGFETAQTGNVVTFNGKQATVVESSATQLVVVAPDEVETGLIWVTVDSEPVLGPVFTSLPLPSVDVVSPLSGPVGTQITIQGQYYSTEADETFVVINGLKIVPTAVTDTEIKFTVTDDINTGTVQVLVNDRYSVDGPEFRTQNLGITAFTPSNGLAGTQVTITGIGFSANVADNTVTFNGVPAVVQSATAGTLVVMAPQGLSTGRIQVSTEGLQQATSPTDFNRAGVSTLANTASGLSLSTTGGAIAVDNNDNVYVTEFANNRIMKISPQGTVTLFVGSASGEEGFQDGQGSAARFRLDANSGLLFDAQQNLYVTDSRNVALRRISPSGVVSTVIPNTFTPIGKMALHVNGDIYIAGSGATVVYRPDAVVEEGEEVFSILIGSGTPLIRPIVTSGISEEGYGDLYSIVNTTAAAYRSRIYRYSNLNTSASATMVDVVGRNGSAYIEGVGTAAYFNQVRGLLLYQNQNDMLVLDAGNYALRRVNMLTWQTSAAMKLTVGNVDGDFRTAKMSLNTWDFVAGRDGAIYILDCGNNAVRKVFLK